MSPFHGESLNLLLPRDGIEEKTIPHADLILPWPWNPIERKVLALGFRVRERARESEKESWGDGRGRELTSEGVRE